jgi:alkanesulfonate monooxygenase SsuD/methylene tetrahydromethanopterin reductase-like flavin-dependent oxidoreductase (luciferase family)
MLKPGPLQEPRVPMWVGGKGGPRLLRLAARLADGWNAAWRWSPSTYAPRAQAAHEQCERLGRDPSTLRLSVGLYCLLGLDEAGYVAAFERGRAAMPGGAMNGETPGSWRADTLSGTPEQAIERVREFEAIGVEEIIIAPWVLPFAVPEPAHVELFADRVMQPLQGAA